MRLLKKVLKWVLIFLLIPVIYLTVSLILTAITIDRKAVNLTSSKEIYLNTNGVHLDIVIPRKDLDSTILSGINYSSSEDYISFGWGDENFYINTPTWNDLTFSNFFRAMFLKSSTLMHVTRYKQKQADWIAIPISEAELDLLSTYLESTFKSNENGMKILLENKGYSTRDDFYLAKGSYSCLNTCNSWANKGFKESGLKSCLWTPFDFGLINKYE